MTTLETPVRNGAEACPAPAYLVFDTESIPDGKLLGAIKYPGEHLAPADAIRKAQAEALEVTHGKSDFLPVTFQVPVALCVAGVAADFRLQSLACLDAPQFRTREIVDIFWKGINKYPDVHLVTFNGRGFDLPLMELCAFRYGCCAQSYFKKHRHRFNGNLDLMDWLCNYGAYRLAGGVNLLSKLLGKPGKMDTTGDEVYEMHLAGKKQQINDYCMFDTLDTYFVFLRTRVLMGVLTLKQEQDLIGWCKDWLHAKTAELPALAKYLDNWGDWQPWP